MQLKAAIDAGDTALVAQLLRTDPQLAKLPIAWGEGPEQCVSDPLHYLADAPFHQIFEHQQQAALARILLEAGAPADGLPSSGETPLHGAASLGEAGVAEALIDFGANIEAVAEYPGIPHGTPLDFAIHFGMVDVVELLVRRGAKILSARMAAGAGQLARISGETAKFAITADNQLDVLRCAVVCDRLPVVEFLLKNRGIDVNADIDGATALHWAAWEAKPRMARFLLAQGADRTARDRHHHATAEQWAAYRGNQLGPRWGHAEVINVLATRLT